MTLIREILRELDTLIEIYNARVINAYRGTFIK